MGGTHNKKRKLNTSLSFFKKQQQQNERNKNNNNTHNRENKCKQNTFTHKKRQSTKGE